jgi:FixJ family two-component response regulator
MTPTADTVVVVDDDTSLRESLASLVRSVGLRVTVFASAQEFLQSPRPDSAACVVLDVRLPAISGLDCQRRLAEAGSSLPIVFITGHGDIQMSVQAMKAGAVEFLTKPFRDQDLIEAVQRALQIDRSARARERNLTELRRRYAQLTRREQEVMSGVVAGLPNKQIAARIGTSEITVKVHRGQVMRKLGATSVPDLVRMAARLEISIAR